VNRRNLIILGLIILLTALSLTAVLVKQYHIPGIGDRGHGNNTMGMSLGLDLSGGIHLVYEVDLSQIGNESAESAVQGAMDIISRRVDAFGVSEPLVQKQGADRISIQLPGIRDMDTAVELIGQTAQLDFRELEYDSEGNPVRDENGDYQWKPATGIDSEGKEVHLTGRYLKRNNQVVLAPNTNEPEVAFEFNSEGAKLFEQVTTRLLEKPLGIFLDNQLISSPTVKAVLSDSGVITGLSLDEARRLAILLNAGALPAPLVGPIVREDIDPTLGADSLRKSLIAGMVGLILVVLFMILYYRLPGALAGVALIIYGILVLAAFKLIPVTLTLSGIAAFILSIGMAVDANVLIFERLKEELRAGRPLSGAIEAGFSRAWSAIRDSNLTTIIVCIILYWMGNMLAEPRVMGFALTLGIGVLLSMFTAVVVTRTFLRLLVGTGIANSLWLFGAKKAEQTSIPKEKQ
jgi:preprotein translocase subunit SecD